MDLTKLTATDLRKLAELIQQKERFNAALAKIDAQLAAFSGEADKPPKAPGRRKVKRAPRGQVKAKILGALKAAGKAGITVKEVSAKTGLSNQRLHSWFSMTGKKVKGLKKVGPGKYAFVG